MTEKLLVLLILALANATISVTLNRASIFDAPRGWLAKKSEFLGKLLSCPYCLSHWVAFALVGIYRPQVLDAHWVLNFLTASFAVVTLTTFCVGLMFASFQQIPAPRGTEQEDAA